MSSLSKVTEWIKENKVAVAVGVGVLGVAAVAYVYTRKQEEPAEESKEDAKDATSSKDATPATETPTPAPTTTEAKPKVEAEAASDEKVEPAAKVAKVEPTAKVVTKAEKKELSCDDLCLMFKDMIQEMPVIMFQLTRDCQQKHAQGASEMEIQQYADEEYLKRREAKHEELLQKYNTDRERSAAAAEKYADVKEFRELAEKLENLNRSMTGDFDQDKMDALPADLTPAKVILVFTDMMNAVTQCLTEAMTSVKLENPTLSGLALDNKIRQKFSSAIQERKTKVFNKHQLKESQLDIALQKYAQNAEVVQAIMGLQAKQQHELTMLRQQLGFPTQ